MEGLRQYRTAVRRYDVTRKTGKTCPKRGTITLGSLNYFKGCVFDVLRRATPLATFLR